MIEFIRHTGDDGIEVVLTFDESTATYHVSASKAGVELTDSFEVSWRNPTFGPDMLDMMEAESRVEVLCKKLLGS